MQHLRSQQYLSAGFPLHLMEVRQGPLEEHSHEFFEMVYVRHGHGAHFIDGAAYPIQAGDLYVISPGEQHRYAPVEGGSLHIVNLLWMPALVEEVLRVDAALQATLDLLHVEPMLRRETRFAHRLHLSGSLAHRVEALLDEMRHEQETAAPGCEVLLRHLFCSLLVILSRAIDAPLKDRPTVAEEAPALPRCLAVARAIEFLEEHQAEPIRVADVAAHTAMSASRLAHLFKQHTGRGIIEYLHELRIGRACSALRQGVRPIGAVAAAAGYADSRFFHRTFRRYTGCNPTQYRAHFRCRSRSGGG